MNDRTGDGSGSDMVSAFHAGERATQARLGVEERMQFVGRKIVRDHMPDEHRELFEKLPFIVIGAKDASGQPVASLLTGPAGFVATTARSMRINRVPDPADPIRAALCPGAPIGLLGIELATRRRNRMNGRITAVSDLGFEIAVSQSYGNCPKYIQTRSHQLVDRKRAPSSRPESALLTSEATALISAADTFFIASASPEGPDWTSGVDVSHRGGKPGFVRVTADADRTVLTFPDFSGNRFFNTLGNLALDPRCGLAFVDFDSGHLLQISARGTVIWDGPELAAFVGAERLLRLEVTGANWLLDAVDLAWRGVEFSPQLTLTGAWPV